MRGADQPVPGALRGASGPTRRWAALLGAVAMVWAMAVPPAVAASRGYRTEDAVIDVVDGPAGDQHVAIDATLYIPSGVDAAHPVDVPFCSNQREHIAAFQHHIRP